MVSLFFKKKKNYFFTFIAHEYDGLIVDGHNMWKVENVLKTQELFRPPNKCYGSIDFTLT